MFGPELAPGDAAGGDTAAGQQQRDPEITAAVLASARHGCFVSTTAVGHVIGRHLACMYSLRSHELKLYLAVKAFRYELAVASATGGGARVQRESEAAADPSDDDVEAPATPAAKHRVGARAQSRTPGGAAASPALRK